ncbi:N-acetylmuramoyl-L-alanine amidase [Mycolicibacterium sp. 018/SC-01/001]|uniref:peptidoglycan recognition protein family protein n=1 Tax=Mycolicibacterium sp. 018/SC-01/001 TaxID=2592069 RepID=UPI0011817683|nr:peptidoglycan recognition family protein [Mycolicibacterium sp. 018/SC-01/001]TRW81260.1 N-acetylmuramoyl-L-alanine amidase [Mycolicibacterium sp. 018/SC-01/001]
MNESQPDGDRRSFISRRRAFNLIGGAGLVALLGACASKRAPGVTPDSSSSMSASLVATTDPQPSPPTDQATASVTPTGVAKSMLCREAWGARAALPGGTPQVPSQITIHHSAVTLGDNRNAPERIRADQRYHQDSQGWIDIAYHIGIDLQGNIYQLRDPEIEGDTATSYDPAGHLLILCEGNFDQEEVTEQLIESVAVACAWGVNRYAISPDLIAGHRDFAATSCPGANLYTRITSGEVRRRVETLVASGAGNLQLICGPEAVAMVEAIEAGG